MESCEINGLKQAILLLEQYTALGTPDELLELKERAERLRRESETLRAELVVKAEVIKDLNRRIEWMQRYAHERQQ